MSPPPKSSVRPMRCLVPLAAFLTLAAFAASAQEGLRSYVIVGDSIPDSLTGQPGDVGRGRAIVANRNVGLCLLCHSAPIPDERFQGNLAPNLAGVGARWNEGQLRLRMVDASRLNANTIMPSYYRLDGLQRVAKSFSGKPILTAEQIEDVVAYLASLKE
jgi:L-cysteine S-thiosulfotransferase